RQRRGRAAAEGSERDPVRGVELGGARGRAHLGAVPREGPGGTRAGQRSGGARPVPPRRAPGAADHGEGLARSGPAAGRGGPGAAPAPLVLLAPAPPGLFLSADSGTNGRVT